MESNIVNIKNRLCSSNIISAKKLKFLKSTVKDIYGAINKINKNYK